MADDVFFLTAADKQVLSELIRDWRNRRPPVTRDGVDVARMPAPIYIAKSQSANGIPALVEGSPDVAGSDECDIYQIVYDGTDPTLVSLGGTSYPVLNLSGSTIPQTYIVVVRTAHGDWVAVPLKTTTHCKGNTTASVAKTASTFTVDAVTAVALGDVAPGNGTTDTFIISNWAKWESNADNECEFTITDMTPESGSLGHGRFAQGACKADQ